jgi:hypothetical protein
VVWKLFGWYRAGVLKEEISKVEVLLAFRFNHT